MREIQKVETVRGQCNHVSFWNPPPPNTLATPFTGPVQPTDRLLSLVLARIFLIPTVTASRAAPLVGASFGAAAGIVTTVSCRTSLSRVK